MKHSLAFKAFFNHQEYSITNIDFINNIATGVNHGSFMDFNLDELLQVVAYLPNGSLLFDKDIIRQGNYTMIVSIEENLQVSFITIPDLSLRNYRKLLFHELDINTPFEILGNLYDSNFYQFLHLLEEK
jgi:hypothetical protein